MRCLAWLYTAPKTQESARISKHAPSKPKSRMQTYLDKGQALPLPDAGCAEHLVGYLFEAGPVGQGAMGEVPLQWQDLTHWQHNTGISLASWEATLLRRLSSDYLNACREAESPTCPAPWLPDDHTSADSRKAVAKHIRSILRN